MNERFAERVEMPKKIEGYKIVTGRTVAELGAAVESEMRSGWQPWGNLVVPGPGLFVQTLVIYED